MIVNNASFMVTLVFPTQVASYNVNEVCIMCLGKGNLIISYTPKQWRSQTKCDGRAQHNPMHTF